MEQDLKEVSILKILGLYKTHNFVMMVRDIEIIIILKHLYYLQITIILGYRTSYTERNYWRAQFILMTLSKGIVLAKVL